MIFGTGSMGKIAHFYFFHHSEYEVVAFTLDSDYIEDRTFCGLPIIPFEEVTNRFPR